MLSSVPQWIALYTNPRAEKRVESLLGEKGFETYLPIRRELHKWSDRDKWVEVPVIKSYIFVRIVKKDLSKVREVEGVVCAVHFGKEVATIPDSQIEELKQFIAAEMKVHMLAVERLQMGKKVRVVSGSLAGHEGVLVSNCEEGNYAVEFSGISLAMVVDIDQDMLEVIEEEAPRQRTRKRKKYTVR